MRFCNEKFRDDRYNLITQEELAEKTGISVNIIKNMESGKKNVNYGDENLESMCNVLNLLSEDYWTRESKTLTCFNNKGGVGKTSLVCNLAVALVSEMNKKVLIVDCEIGRASCRERVLRLV